MKTKPKPLWLAAMLMALLAWPAAAHTVRSRPASGVIESLDSGKRAVQFASTTGHAPRQLVLTRQTRFLHDWQFASAGEVKPGTKGVIYYRTPFFGKPFITKVVWSNGG